MVRSLLFLSVLFLTALSFFGTAVYAEDQEAVNQRKVCLDPLRCSEGFNAGKCSGQFVENWSHRARLDIRQSSPPLTNVPTYVIECIALSHVSGGGTVCTTGSADTDAQLGYESDGVPNATFLRSENKATFIFYGMFKDGVEQLQNPIPAGTTYQWLEWEDFTDVHATQKHFVAINFYRPSAPDTPVVLTEQEKKSLQQATLRFLQTQIDNPDTNCVDIFYDPYGKVFDSQTLDPVSGASVTLMRKRDNGEFSRLTSAELRGGVIKNPQTTAEDGSYFFPVPDGDYKLFVSHPNFTFPVSDELDLTTTWGDIYSDIYPLKTGEVITQKGAIQHRDIPVKSKFPQQETAPDFMSYFYENVGQGKIGIRGATTKAFTTLTFYSRKKELTSENSIRNRQIFKVESDKEGKFKAIIDTKDFEPGEYFGEVDLQKIKAQAGALLAPATSALPLVTTVLLEPLPSYLEGVVYDQLGKPVPNAQVSFFTPHSSIPTGSVVADGTGLIVATTDQLPTLKFTLEVTTATGAKFTVDPSEFIVQNTKYLAERNVGIYTTKLSAQAQAQIKKEPTKKSNLVPSKPQAGSFYNPFGQGGNQTSSPVNATTSQSSSTMFALLLGILILFGVAAVGGLVYYFLKLRVQNQQTQ